MNLERLRERLRIDEGERARPYKCSAGKTTIGVGRNLDDVGLSADEIELLLSNDILRAVGLARSVVRGFDSLNDARQEVLVNMAFNLGGKLRQFRRFLDAVQAGKWDAAANEMLDSLWADQVGARATRLAAAMKKGAW